MTEHVIDDLHEYALEILDPTRAGEIREHLRACRDCLLQLGHINDSLADTLIEPSGEVATPALRSRLLTDIASITPYSLYHDDMARLLQASKGAVNAEMGLMPHPASWVDGPIPDCRLLPWTAESDKEDSIMALVLMESGSHFPMHEHIGDETVLIVQGSLLNDDGKLYRPGEQLHMVAGTSHEFNVPEGLDLIYLAISEKGVRIGDLLIKPGDL